MANEISLSIGLSASKGGGTMTLSFSATQDMAGSDMTQVTQELTTTPELADLGDVATPAAYVFVRNLETETNDVHLSLNSDGSNKFATIKPGKAMVFPPATGQNVYLSASSTTARVMLGAIEL